MMATVILASPNKKWRTLTSNSPAIPDFFKKERPTIMATKNIKMALINFLVLKVKRYSFFLSG